jgi:hypothetical protein
VCGSRVWICWNIIIWMPQGLWIKRHLKGCKHSLCQSSTLIFRVKIRVEVHHVSLGYNSLRVGRSILVQCSKVDQAQSCQLKRKQVMETIKAILSRVIYCKTAP